MTRTPWIILLFIFYIPQSFAQFSFESVRALVEDHQIKKIKDLIPLLPPEFRHGQDSIALAHQSLSLQEASRDYPRAILHDIDSNVFIAFNDNPLQANFNDLEIEEFNSSENEFHFHFIRFPEGDGTVEYSERDPDRCTTCHGQDRHPIFGIHPFWPGFVGSMYQIKYYSEFSHEKSVAAAILSRPDQGRYASLNLKDTLDPYRELFGASLLSDHIQSLQAPRIAQWIVNSKDYDKFKWAIFSALEPDCGSIQDFLPQSWQQSLGNFSDVLADTVSEHKAINDEMKKISGLDLASTYPMPCAHTQETVALRYVFEGRGIDMHAWAMTIEGQGSCIFSGDNQFYYALKDQLTMLDKNTAFLFTLKECAEAKAQSIAALSRLRSF